MRLLSYNIHKGFSGANRRYLLREMRSAIQEVSADTVFLQEVIGEHRKMARLHNTDAAQFEYLADTVWPHYAYGKNAIYSRGHHGNAILSKHPFDHWHNYDLSRYWFSQRGLLHGRIGDLHLFCVHLGLLGGERRWQLDKLIGQIQALVSGPEPVIIAGDFNDWNLRCHRELTDRLQMKEALSETFGRPARTFPAALPLLRTDRIYYRNLSLVDADCLSGLHWRRLSDHCPLYAEFAGDRQQP